MELTSDSETEPLIRLPGPPPQQQNQFHLFPQKFLCLPSKGAVLVLFWTLVVGTVYQFITAGSILVTHSISASHSKVNHSNSHLYKGTHFEVQTFFIICIIFCLVSFFYPLAGCIADTVIGRYRMVLYSSLFLVCGCVSYSVGSVLYFSNAIRADQATVVYGLKELAAPLLIGFLLTFIGFSGYQSNYIQLGLDQLQDAPSHSLGLFVHAVVWFLTIGLMLVQLAVAWGTCRFDQRVIHFLVSLPFVFILALLVLVVVGRWKRQWFHAEPVRHNPYKTVFQVINFSWKHKYPIQYSTYEYDEEQPSRFDYAKERFGGPFTTEQVEDVKTFLKIISVLLSLGPVFTLTSPTILFYANFVEHVTMLDKTNTSCSWKWIVLDMGGLRYLVATLFFPIYIWLLYSALRNRIPKIFTRLLIWILILVICVGSMVFIDLTGHILYYNRKHVGAACLLSHNVMADDDKAATQSLQLPWPVVLLPTALSSVAPIMIVTTTFEFITAQSPYSMKGFLVGVFFAIMGLFRLIGSLILLPFYLPHFWSAEGTSVHVVNCGFGYLLSICTVGIVGFILFLLVSKKYQYRERR
jgi:peptide/histidine transporter 3/4